MTPPTVGDAAIPPAAPTAAASAPSPGATEHQVDLTAGDPAPAGPAIDPGRVDPMAALSALDQDMDELRRRVASLGDS